MGLTLLYISSSECVTSCLTVYEENLTTARSKSRHQSAAALSAIIRLDPLNEYLRSFFAHVLGYEHFKHHFNMVINSQDNNAHWQEKQCYLLLIALSWRYPFDLASSGLPLASDSFDDISSVRRGLLKIVKSLR